MIRLKIRYSGLLDSLYQANDYKPIWLRRDKSVPEANSFINLIQNSRLWGLFPNDYHYNILSFINRAFLLDTNAARNAALWARKDLLLTDAFFQMARHLKQGRIPFDSVTLRTDTILQNRFYTDLLNEAMQSGNVTQVLHQLEPDRRDMILSKPISGHSLTPLTLHLTLIFRILIPTP